MENSALLERLRHDGYCPRAMDEGIGKHRENFEVSAHLYMDITMFLTRKWRTEK